MGIWITAMILVILAVLPLGVRVRYNDTGCQLKVIAGPLKFTVFPMKKKPKKGKRKKKQKMVEQETPEAEKDALPQPPKAGPEKKPKEKGGSLTRFLPLIRLGLDFLNDFRRKIRMDHLYLRLILAGDDPCDLAVNYGRIWAAIGNLLPLLERIFVIKKRDIEVECDFTGSETLVVAHVDITITLGRLLALVLYYGIRVLIELFAMKRKGGGVK